MKKTVFIVLVVLTMLLLTTSPVAAKGKIKMDAWNVPGDFATIQEAIDSPDVQDGDMIRLKTGTYEGASVNKAVTIKGTKKSVIDTGPLHPAGLTIGLDLLAGSDGARISNICFDNVDLAVRNADGIDNVVVEQCVFLNAIQAVSNWSGSGWNINHNVITDLRTRNGGGIGILVGERFGGVVQNNTVAHNIITGVLSMYESEQGGYNGSGIVIYADFRYGTGGAEEISGNRVMQNKVCMTSEDTELVDIVAFEMTDSRYDPLYIPDPVPPEWEMVIFDNYIGFNDLRCTDIQMTLTPEELADCNVISRNPGDNRRHHPGDQHGRRPSHSKPHGN